MDVSFAFELQLDDGNFWRFDWLLLRRLQSPAILYDDMLPLVGLLLIAK